jgi:hypothetical protein
MTIGETNRHTQTHRYTKYYQTRVCGSGERVLTKKPPWNFTMTGYFPGERFLGKKTKALISWLLTILYAVCKTSNFVFWRIHLVSFVEARGENQRKA